MPATSVVRPLIRTLKTFVLAACALLVCSTARASETVSAITTLTCTRSDNSTLTAHAYSYDFGTGSGNPLYFSIYTYGSNFYQFAFEEYFGSGYSYCSFANMTGMVPQNITVVDVSSYGVGAYVGAGSIAEDSISQTYTLVTFAYSGLSIAQSAVKAGPATTPAQKAHALEVYKASIPPLAIKH